MTNPAVHARKHTPLPPPPPPSSQGLQRSASRLATGRAVGGGAGEGARYFCARGWGSSLKAQARHQQSGVPCPPPLLAQERAPGGGFLGEPRGRKKKIQLKSL